jgi:hypothetical protein
MFYMLLFSGAGDGAGGNAITGVGTIPFYVPSVYLLSLFVCCFRFVRGSALKTAAILSYGLLAVSLLVIVTAGPFGIVLALPLVAFAFAAHRLLFRKEN